MNLQIEELRTLPIADRVQLVEELWDSIAQETPEIVLSQHHKDVIDKRLDALDMEPSAGTPWDIAKQRIIDAL